MPAEHLRSAASLLRTARHVIGAHRVTGGRAAALFVLVISPRGTEAQQSRRRRRRAFDATRVTTKSSRDPRRRLLSSRGERTVTLVVGATGLLGTEICRRLRARGKPVRALVRFGSANESNLRALGAEIVHGDLKDRASLEAACRSASRVVTTANVMTSRRRGDSLESVDRDGQLALLDAAKRAGIAQFIYVSVSPRLPSNNPFVRYKRELEQAVRASGMTWTILQPTAFMEIHAGPALGWDFAKGRARLLGSGRVPLSYVSALDVAEFAVVADDNPGAANRFLHIAGPEPLTGFDAVRIAEKVTGRRFTVQRMPTAMLKALSAVLRPVAPIPSSLLAMGAGLDSGDTVDMAPLLRDFPVAQTSFAQYVQSRVVLG
jgi:NADH dehydrogenase